MQRGRGRGRGRNSNPAQSNSRRGHRSTNRTTISGTSSNTPQSQSRNSRPSLRRSARIAELLNGELNHLEPSSHPSSHQPTSNSSMADVARPRALGNRSVRSRHHSGNTRTPGRSRSGRPSLSPEDIRYAMDIVVQPPRTARAGQTLTGSIIVRLRTTNADADEAIADSTNLVAVATLVPGPNSTASSDPQVLNSLLAGRRFDSIHPFSDDEADGSIASMDMADPRGVGYMRFPELIIRQAGTYRIRITLIRIPNSPSHPPVASTGGGASVQIVDSNPIIVQGSNPTSNMAAYNGDEDAEDDGGWLEVLRSIQERRRSR